MCTVLLPQGDNPTAVNKYIISYVRKCLYEQPLGKQATITDILLYAVFYLYTLTDVTFYFHEVYTTPCYSRIHEVYYTAPEYNRMLWIPAVYF